MSGKHQSSSNQIKEVDLPSAIEQVQWLLPVVACGGLIGYEILTSFIANGAKLNLTIKDGNGKTHLTEQRSIYLNQSKNEWKVPLDAQKNLTIEAELPDHGLKKTSAQAIVIPRVEITNLKWSKKEIFHGEDVDLSADIRGLPDGFPVEVIIMEHDQQGAHDFITKFTLLINGGKIETKWNFFYTDSQARIPSYNERPEGYINPSYFFRVAAAGIFADSPLLLFKDWIEVVLLTFTGKETFILHKPDGSQKSGSFDSKGKMFERKTIPGNYSIEIKTND